MPFGALAQDFEPEEDQELDLEISPDHEPTTSFYLPPSEEHPVKNVKIGEEYAIAEEQKFEKIAGDVFTSVAKEIIAVNQMEDQIYYLVSWH